MFRTRHHTLLAVFNTTKAADGTFVPSAAFCFLAFIAGKGRG
jgi:hypothetical protein